MAISFKNVGIRKDTKLNEDPVENNKSLIPIGIKTPIKLGIKDNELFEMNYIIVDQIRDNLKNLILTNHGERLIQYNFGANLRPLLFDYSNKENFDNEAMVNINTAVTKYMPFINLLDYESAVQKEDGMSKIRLRINYTIPLLNILKEELEVILTTK
jgi:phage baseplate assembly protein W